MLVFFSGDTSRQDWPENRLPSSNELGVMPTWFDIRTKKSVRERFEALLLRETSPMVLPVKKEQSNDRSV